MQHAIVKISSKKPLENSISYVCVLKNYKEQNDLHKLSFGFIAGMDSLKQLDVYSEVSHKGMLIMM